MIHSVCSLSELNVNKGQCNESQGENEELFSDVATGETGEEEQADDLPWILQVTRIVSIAMLQGFYAPIRWEDPLVSPLQLPPTLKSGRSLNAVS